MHLRKHLVHTFCRAAARQMEPLPRALKCHSEPYNMLADCSSPQSFGRYQPRTPSGTTSAKSSSRRRLSGGSAAASSRCSASEQLCPVRGQCRASGRGAKGQLAQHVSCQHGAALRHRGHFISDEYSASVRVCVVVCSVACRHAGLCRTFMKKRCTVTVYPPVMAGRKHKRRARRFRRRANLHEDQGDLSRKQLVAVVS